MYVLFPIQEEKGYQLGRMKDKRRREEKRRGERLGRGSLWNA